MRYLKLYKNHSEYEAEVTSGLTLPNVSHCIQEAEVHYNPIETRVVTTYNVTSTSEPTPIGYNQFISAFTEIEIDGVVLPNVVSAYTFDTIGEHTVKYTLSDSTSIKTRSFSDCTSLTSISIPNSITSIGNYVFDYCSGLTSITIPDSVTSIGKDAFNACRSLTSATIGSGVTSIGEYAFNTCFALSSVTIQGSITSISVGTFNYCSGLTEVTIPSSVTSIGQGAFNNCTKLSSIIIPDNVTSIGDSVFYACHSLTSINIPSGTTTIGEFAFNGCSNLASITSLATAAPTIQSNTFQNVKRNGTLTVPSGSSGYDVWMGTGNSYLGKYGWTKVEQ